MMVDGDRTEGTRPAGYKGRVPRPLRPPLEAQRWLMNEARAAELRLPYRAEELRRGAAHRIRGLTHERRFDGFGSIVLNRDGGSVTLYWKGGLPEAMDELVNELRRDVAIDVRGAPYSKDELIQETHRIIDLDPAGVRITSVGPRGDCSGLRVTVDEGNDLTQASREITSWIRLEFGVRSSAAGDGCTPGE